MRSSEIGAALARLGARPIAHRGLHGCGRAGPIENSFGAATAAVAAGFGIECDIQLSADGEAMVFHDDLLDRLTDATGPLVSRRAVELSTLTLRGSPDRIPTLRQFLAAIDGRAPVVIEIKTDGRGDTRLADRALELVRAYSGPVAFECFDPSVVLHCLDAGAPCPVGLVGPPETAGDGDPFAMARCDFLSWSIADLQDLAASEPPVPLTTWTVRTPAQVAVAEACRAQIVFEGFLPEASAPGVAHPRCST